MHDLTLSIDCNLDFGDTLSYQDSFVYYDKDAGIAYNDSCVDYGYELNTTNGELQPTGDYSEYLQEYIPEDESAYDDYYDDYCYASDISTAIYRGCRISINGDRASFDYNIWHWSDFEDAYIYYTECCYVDREGDYFLLDDCVRDIADYWQLEKDCVFSQYSDEYILADYAKWSEDMASYIDSDDAIWCDYEQDWIHNDLVCYSEITGRHYCSEQSMRKDEEHFRKEHALALMA